MKYITILLVILAAPIFSQEDEECTFDQKTQTDEFVRGVPEFSDYTWDSQIKVATIKLENGSILKAHRGGCVHFGISGELYLKDSEKGIRNLEYWFERSLWIAQRLFSEHDYNVLHNSILNKTYSNQSGDGFTYLLIPHDSYNEFSISVKKEGDIGIVYVGYYF